MIANLVQNALKFASEAVTVERRIEDQRNESWAVITVEDDGPGISEEDQPHVFERLYLARHTSRPKEAGSGLGLAIVAELTAAMEGRVSVIAREPSGTRFIVKLPVENPTGPEP